MRKAIANFVSAIFTSDFTYNLQASFAFLVLFVHLLQGFLDYFLFVYYNTIE